MLAVARFLAALPIVALALTHGIAPAAAQPCASCVPLDDPSGPAYLGTHALGLYPGASNLPPPAHQALAAAAAAAVVPRDAAGNPDPAGWIGLISIGMSNCNQEFAAFERIADATSARNARLVVVDGAVGGQSADVIWNASAPYWSTVMQRVAVAGLSPEQVQVVWLKEAESASGPATFPASAETLQAHVRSIVRNLKVLFPRLQLCFLASRIYGGYAGTGGLGEPISYEGGFAMRWTIEDQIAGDPALNPDPGQGAVESAVLLWGPYLWANGTTPRASDGLTWQLGDLEGDFVHPSPSGEAKVAALLDGFLNTSPYAAPWYLADPGPELDTLGAIADAHVDITAPATNFGSAGVLQWVYNSVRAYVKFDLESVTGTLLHAKLGMKTPANTATRPIEIVGVTNTTWDEATITAATSPAFDGGPLDTIPNASRGTAVGVDVTGAVQAALAQPPGSRRVTFGLRTLPGSAAVQEVLSRESGEGPWLVLTLDAGVAGLPHSSVAPPALRLRLGPNPSRGALSIQLDRPRGPAFTTLRILDPQGRRIRELHGGPLAAGTTLWTWDGRDQQGRSAPAGIYWAEAATSGERATARFVRIF